VCETRLDIFASRNSVRTADSNLPNDPRRPVHRLGIPRAGRWHSFSVSVANSASTRAGLRAQNFARSVCIITLSATAFHLESSVASLFRASVLYMFSKFDRWADIAARVPADAAWALESVVGTRASAADGASSIPAASKYHRALSQWKATSALRNCLSDTSTTTSIS